MERCRGSPNSRNISLQRLACPIIQCAYGKLVLGTSSTVLAGAALVFPVNPTTADLASCCTGWVKGYVVQKSLALCLGVLKYWILSSPRSPTVRVVLCFPDDFPCS